MAVKKTAAKETKVEEVKAVEAKAETKAETKPAKKTAAKAKEPKVNVEVQFQGKDTKVNDVVEAVKAAYKADGNTDAIETVEIYIQPETSVAYYVVNGKNEGKSVNL